MLCISSKVESCLTLKFYIMDKVYTWLKTFVGINERHLQKKTS